MIIYYIYKLDFAQIVYTAIVVSFVIPTGGHVVLENALFIEKCVEATGPAGTGAIFLVNVTTTPNTAMSELCLHDHHTLVEL